LGHIMRKDSLVRTIIDKRTEGKKTKERLRMRLLDRMMKVGYSKLKNRDG